MRRRRRETTTTDNDGEGQRSTNKRTVVGPTESCGFPAKTMKFGERLLSSQHPPWSENYINYERLKRLLDLLFGQESPVDYLASSNTLSKYGLTDQCPSDDVAIGSAVTSSHSFQRELNDEIQKALLFLLKTMGELASDLTALSDQRRFIAVNFSSIFNEKEREDHAVDQQLWEINRLKREYIVRIGSKLLLLLEFVELNVEAIVKIVKKHDKLLSRWEESSGSSRNASANVYTRLRRQYLPRFAVNSSNPNVRCLFMAAADAGNCDNWKGELATTGPSNDGSFGGWDVVQWELEVALKELHGWQHNLQDTLMLDDGSKAGMNSKMPQAAAPKAHTFIPMPSRSFSELPGVTRLLSSSTSIIGLANRFNSHANFESLIDEKSSFFEPSLYQIHSARRRLGQMHHRYIRMVYAHEMLHLIDDQMPRQDDDKYFEMERIRKISLGGDDDRELLSSQQPTVSMLSKYLNLISAGLYMVGFTFFKYNLFLTRATHIK